MADDEANGVGEGSEEGEEYSSASSSDYDSEDSSSDDDDGGGGGGEGGGRGRGRGRGRYDSKKDEPEEDNPAEANFRAFSEILDSRSYRKKEEEEVRGILPLEDQYDFPIDKENWCEEDLGELWDDAPVKMTKPGWDPDFADDDDWDAIMDVVKDGSDPPIAPFYLPYRKHYPVIPDNHYDISNAKAVIEELDRTEEFLIWVSFIFEDGSSYEGTVWDDLAHGKGVYIAEEGLVRYEGEWLQNQMEGHGVVEVDIPAPEPIPGSKFEAKMRAEGKIISRDFMSPEDRKWLEMDIEDSLCLAEGQREIPFYERNEWIQVFGKKPEKGRYRYAGQWKHGRMHGCGVYEVNERIISGRFYFGHFVGDSTGCDSDVSTLHAGIAEVAAAKARMFVNKPDGMVREERGPYSDPQHPYFYEEDDVWMAPGFINQFYDVPNYWKTYAEEVDQEREMWLNSFYKAPLRLPMPAELEYWWEKGEVTPEFVLINKEPEPDPDDPSQLIYTDDPLILHTPTGRLIYYVDDEKYGVRLFWQPPSKEGKDVDPDKSLFLPLGFDDFYGRSAPAEKKEGPMRGLITSIQNTLKPLLDGLGHWAKEKLEASEMKLKLIEKQLEFVEAEISLEEEIEDLDRELKRKQEEEEEKQGVADKNQDDAPASAAVQDEAVPEEMEDEDEDEDADDGEGPTSFGTVNQGRTDDDTTAKGSKPRKFPFSSLSLSLLHSGPLSVVPIILQESFVSWRNRCSSGTEQSSYEFCEQASNVQKRFCSLKFNGRINQSGKLRVMQQRQHSNTRRQNCSSLNSLASVLLANSHKNKINGATKSSVGIDELSILSLHVPVMDAAA